MLNVSSTARPSVSIVAPCHNEAEVLHEFHRRVSLAACGPSGDDYEIVLVDDGSRDATWEIIAGLASQDAHVVGVRLMRNFGHQPAASAGLALARGEQVLLIDADLQDPPELLQPMMQLMDQGYDVVYGKRTRREAETWFKRATASLFYRLLGRLAATDIPRDTGDFRLMRRSVVEALAAMPERQRFIRGMVSWIGGRQIGLSYDRQARFAGTSKYPMRKMLHFALDAITSFSTVPLRIASYCGVISAVASLLLLAYTVGAWFSGRAVVGWASTMTAISLFGAVQLLVLGIFGEYLGRLFQEVKARPLFLVDQVVAGGTAHAVPSDFAVQGQDGRRDVHAALLAQPPTVAR